MYRVFLILAGGLALAACSSTPSWMSLDSLKPAPPTETVRFESDPPGADARTSTGQTCKTPCSLALPSSAPLTVTFTLAGYQPETEQLELIASGSGFDNLRPNPVIVELTAAPPAPRKPAPAKRPAKKPAPKPAAAAAPPGATAAAPNASPWPTPQQAR